MLHGSLLENFSGFDLVCYIPPVVPGAGRERIADVARTAYGQMLDVLDAAGFYFESELDLTLSDRGFELTFGDTDLGFSFAVVDNRIVLRRRGSSSERFDAWY